MFEWGIYERKHPRLLGAPLHSAHAAAPNAAGGAALFSVGLVRCQG